MIYPNDFQLSRPKVRQGENSIDSYALLVSIISEIENYSLQFHLDNSLPLIQGDSESLEEVFKGFVLNAINKFKEEKGTLHILYRKDLESSFLAFFIKDLIPPQQESSISNLVDTITDFNLALCEKPLNEIKHVEDGAFLGKMNAQSQF